MKKAKAKSGKLVVCRERIAVAEKAAREAQAKADAIDAAVFDLKAVNPRARVERDIRTPAQILDAIAGHGQDVDAALAKLRQLLKIPAK